MPYNNTPITPSKEVTGHVSLPLARVQKIIQADPERLATSKNASFAIALATEMFIQHLATTTHNVVKAERKPRRNIQYRDVSAAVAKTDNLEFLVDVVPKTVTYREFKKKQEKMAKEKESEKEKEKEKEKNGKIAPKDDRVEEDEDEDEHEHEDEEEEEEQEQGQEVKETHTHTPHHHHNNLVPEQPETEPEKAPEPMDIENEADRVEDSEPEQDEAAMQIEMEMEMRGPPRLSESPRPRRSGGFTAINGK